MEMRRQFLVFQGIPFLILMILWDVVSLRYISFLFIEKGDIFLTFFFFLSFTFFRYKRTRLFVVAPI